jgi:MFS family permease
MHTPLPLPFQRLAWSNLAAQSAEQLSLAAVPLVAVLMLGAGPGEIGLLAALQTLPFLLLAIPLGLLADRVSRCRLMVAAETLRALSLLALLAMVLSGQLSIAGLACWVS